MSPIRESPSSLHRSYFRALYLGRMTLVAFWACFVYFVLWAIPWMPGGLSVSDYTREFLTTLAFAGSCMLLGLLAVTLRATTRQRREALVAWTSLYDDTTGLHNRNHFYDCLSLECERAERHGSSFALILLRLDPSPPKRGRRAPRVSGTILRSTAEVVKNLTRSTDLLALISNSEFAVLVLEVSREQALQLAQRLRQSMSTRLPALVGAADPGAWPSVKVSVSTYGDDCRTPESLVEAARLALRQEPHEGPTAAQAAV